jgi:Flp pilus assembly pilin Flp
MLTLIRDYILRDDGSALVEYGIISASIALVSIGALTTIGNTVNTTFTNAVNALYTFETGPAP